MIYIIRLRTSNRIRAFYQNVARKFKNTYSLDLLLKNIDDALDAIYQIENGLQRRTPSLTRWKGYYMAAYTADGKTRWNYAYRIEGNTIYVEDACHAQNMSEFVSTVTPVKQRYRRLTKKPLFGYSFVMNDKREYNLIDKDGRLITQWFKAIKPLQQPYGKYRIIAYVNVNGYFCALGYDGKVYSFNRTWKEVYTENKQIIDSELFINLITESIDNKEKNFAINKGIERRKIRLTEAEFYQLITECVLQTLKEIC